MNLHAPAVVTTPKPSVPDSIEPAIVEVEKRLAALALSLHEPGSRGVDTAAAELQHALARASAQVASQRDTLARATAALDRAIDVLLPRDTGVYNARGAAAHNAHSGSVQA